MQSSRNLTNTAILRPQQRDLLALRKWQITPGVWRQVDRCHAARFTKPSRPQRLRYVTRQRCGLGLHTLCDALPECSLRIELIDTRSAR
ncbi:hypothetical protein X948_5132 [Burkholderia pseudomallei MSHR5608]|nr:hypothetical protein X948_5132 [Burkholderia pseudomallei MSHR5608]